MDQMSFQKCQRLNFLNPFASRVGQLLIGNTTEQNCEPFSKLKNKNFDIVLSFGSEKIVDTSFDNCFRVYFGHHGDEGAMKSDLVLPTPLFTEKNGIFVNISVFSQRFRSIFRIRSQHCSTCL